MGKDRFPQAVGTVRNSAQDFLQAVAEVGTSGPLSHGVVAAVSGTTRSRFGSGIWGKITISHHAASSPRDRRRTSIVLAASRRSERFRGRVALPALSGPLPRSAITNASARNARQDAPRGPIRPRRQSTKRPASTSRRALNSTVEPDPNFRWRCECPGRGGGRFLRTSEMGIPIETGGTVSLSRSASR